MVEEEEYWGWLELIEVEQRSILLHNLWILSPHSGNYMINNAQSCIESIWATLLTACRKHGNIEIAEIAAQELITLGPKYAGCYVLLANIYAILGRWEDFSRMRRKEESGLEKIPGFSWIEVDGEVHGFVVGDKFHPQSKEIYCTLDELECQLRSSGNESPIKSAMLTDSSHH